jgi:hypothetical protein
LTQRRIQGGPEARQWEELRENIGEEATWTQVNEDTISRIMGECESMGRSFEVDQKLK